MQNIEPGEKRKYPHGMTLQGMKENGMASLGRGSEPVEVSIVAKLSIEGDETRYIIDSDGNRDSVPESRVKII